jgi:hypothetical protein
MTRAAACFFVWAYLPELILDVSDRLPRPAVRFFSFLFLAKADTFLKTNLTKISYSA